MPRGVAGKRHAVGCRRCSRQCRHGDSRTGSVPAGRRARGQEAAQQIEREEFLQKAHADAGRYGDMSDPGSADRASADEHDPRSQHRGQQQVGDRLSRGGAGPRRRLAWERRALRHGRSGMAKGECAGCRQFRSRTVHESGRESRATIAEATMRRDRGKPWRASLMAGRCRSSGRTAFAQEYAPAMRGRSDARASGRRPPGDKSPGYKNEAR